MLGGYTNAEIAAKIDLTPDYIAAICYLLEHGEERLLVAVERGVMPANVAMEIARASDSDIQQALAEAYENKLLPGNQILAIRRIILRRNQRRKSAPSKGRGIPHTGKIAAAALIRTYQDEAQRQKLLVKKARAAPGRAKSGLPTCSAAGWPISNAAWASGRAPPRQPELIVCVARRPHSVSQP